MKKLIFLRYGRDDVHKLMDFFGTPPILPVADIDIYIQQFGYNKTINAIIDYKNEGFYITTYPSILHNEFWWNKEKGFWEIYFVENNKIKNISEYTDRELKQSHNIEKLYLAGDFD